MDRDTEIEVSWRQHLDEQIEDLFSALQFLRADRCDAHRKVI